MTALVICLLAAANLTWRVWRRQASRTDLWIVAFVIGHFALIQLQMLVCDHSKAVYWRYHLPTVVLLIPMAARVFSWDSPRLIRQHKWLCSVIALLILSLVSLRLYYRPWRRYAGWRRDFRDAEAWAAKVIDADWDGPRSGRFVYSPREYRVSKLPVVCGYGGRIAYQVHGRAAFDKQCSFTEVCALEPVDYCCFPKGFSVEYVKWVRENGGVLIAARKFGRVDMEIYRMPAGVVPPDFE